MQSQFSNTQFTDKSRFSDYFAEDHFFQNIKTSHLVTIVYFLPLRFSDTKLGIFVIKSATFKLKLLLNIKVYVC